MQISFLLVTIILYLLLESLLVGYNRLEGYDGKIEDEDRASCAERCKTTSDCAGFAYNQTNQTCYLSHTPIGDNAARYNSPFGDEYDENYERCNKIYSILQPTGTNTHNRLEKQFNAIYECGPNKDKWIHNNGTFTKMEGNSIPDEELADYEVTNNPATWTPELSDKVALERITERQLDMCPPQVPITVPSCPPQKDITFVESDQYIDKKYLYPAKCLENMPREDCLAKCRGESFCKAVEWNPVVLDRFNNEVYRIRRNICCPKYDDKLRPRPKKYEFGKSYLKNQPSNSGVIEKIGILKSN